MERIEGDRKRRIAVTGSEMRALQDAIKHADGRRYLDSRRGMQVGKKLSPLIERYKLMDQSAAAAAGKDEE